MKLYDRKEVLADVANLLYVIGDVREGEYSPHTLHQTFDICAPGNIDRAHRTLDRALLRVDSLMRPMRGVARHLTLLRGLTHEYLVATVLVDWLEIAFPPLTAHTAGVTSTRIADSVIAIWKEKSAAAWTDLSAAVRSLSGTPYAFARRVPPI